MLIIPAIDLLEGKCVRLVQGDFARKTVYSEAPVEVAREFERKGADMLHVVDLDGARTGKPANQEVILRIRSAVRLPMEVGGGISTLEYAATYLNAGVERVVIGTRAMEDLAFLEACLKRFGSHRVVVSLDVRDGRLAIRGWVSTTRESHLDFARKIQGIGVTEIVVTDISRDGTMTSPDFQGVEDLVRMGFRVVASGGISDAASLARLKSLGAAGSILGKALYEKKLSLAEALAAIKGQSGLTRRIIPCLDVKEGRVVKGIRFRGLRDAGDPVELGKRYSDEGADELVFLDIAASREERETMVSLAREVGRNLFIPFTVGGGIRSVEEIRRLLHSGADKVSINTAAVEDPSLINEASERFGSQCVVVAMDVKKEGNGYFVFVKGGTERTPLEARAWAREAEKRGAGEILLTSMDRDGTRLGFDLDLLREISSLVNIPIIASGGAGSLEDMKGALEAGADAVLAASLFHYGEVSVQEAKGYLKSCGFPIRP